MAITRSFLDHCQTVLSDRLQAILHCVNQLSDEQLWKRARTEMNSIANLMLHLAGNVRQWIVTGVPQSPDHRDRPSEFSADGNWSKEQLIGHLELAVQDAIKAIATITPDMLLEKREIQGFSVNVLTAVFHSVEHFSGHTQEIISMTRQEMGTGYAVFKSY